jgi:23S rRNA (cytosine1962-C5)-methyltransferase
MTSGESAPLILHEDEHLLLVDKPAGWNTHAPNRYAGEGIYDWLRHREPRWASLSIIHRLDKETSGVMVFGKTKLANQSLTRQFTEHTIRKKYFLLTDHPVARSSFTVANHLVREGNRYRSTTARNQGEAAATKFTVLPPDKTAQLKTHNSQFTVLLAEPVTGRTHQIRVHAAESGFPIMGDALYGGTLASRVCLHAHSLTLRHPATDEEVTFEAPVDFAADSRLALRKMLLAVSDSTACRLIHGASDGWPDCYVDLLDGCLIAQSAEPPGQAEMLQLEQLREQLALKGVYYKRLNRHIGRSGAGESSAQFLTGKPVAGETVIEENGVRFALRFDEGYSVGLFLDQRDNRRRFLTGHVAAQFPLFPPPEAVPHSTEVLNTFAYTCGFSVCAATAGARTTSLDLSKKYLEWGKRNFALNGLDASQHEFIYGDSFDWMRRLAKKERRFDAIALDPPTFSRSKESGLFQAEKHYGKLVATALPLLKVGGVLFASTNAAQYPPEEFIADVHAAVESCRRKIVQQHYVPQPPDFPISREEPAYLKTLWLRVK